MSPYQHELTVARQAVHLASLLTKAHLLTYKSTQSQVSEETKADASEVTVADFAAQAIIISIVHAQFPRDAFIAEESSEMLRSDAKLAERVWDLAQRAADMVVPVDSKTAADVKLPGTVGEMMDIIDLGQAGGKGRESESARTWVLDPIDGTKTYIRGQQYAVCLCLLDEGEQRVAVLGCSNLNLESRDSDGRIIVREDVVDLEPEGGWLLSAIKGQGTYLERIASPGPRVRVEDFVGPGLAAYHEKNEGAGHLRLRFTDSSASSHISKDLHNAIFEHFLPPDAGCEFSAPAVPEGDASRAVDIWSMQFKYVILTLRASGADAMIRTPPLSTYHAAVWDHAGGQLLLTESGGRLTDANGDVFAVDGRTRKLEQNWGVCATRGGDFGRGVGPQEAHAVVLAKVRELVGKRTQARALRREED